MSITSTLPDLLMFFPALRTASESLLELVAHDVQPFRAADGERLITDGEVCRATAMMIAGRARVVRCGPVKGRSILMCRIGPGELCPLAALSALSDTPATASVIAEGPISGVWLPARPLRALLSGCGAFAQQFFERLALRQSQMLKLIDDLTFNRLEQRLARRLLDDAHPLQTTHQALAEELGSAREVISRLLKDFEQREWVALRRGSVSIRNQSALRQLLSQA